MIPKSTIIALIFVIPAFLCCENYRVKDLKNYIGFKLKYDKVIANTESHDEFENTGYFVNVYRLTNDEIFEFRNDPTFDELQNKDAYFENPGIAAFIKNESDYLIKTIEDEKFTVNIIVNISDKELLFGKLYE